jgi:sarcosine oxidase, subunit alpha
MMPGCLTDPAMPITFSFEGQSIAAVQGQSIAAALYASGRRIFSRSFKYHRPRGLFCVAGDCPNCLMQVDGRPNVRTCIEPVREGQIVCSQHAWPSLNFDLLRIFDKLERFLPVGFYYKHFHKPRWLWPIFERVVRRLAGLGRIDLRSVPILDNEVEYLHTDICIIGGGASGLAAANSAAKAGADVLLLERLPKVGGRLLWEGGPSIEPDQSVRLLLNTVAFGLYEGNLLGAVQHERLLKIRAKQIIVCTGSRQPLVPFHNNDLPGVMSCDGVLRLAKLYGVLAGRRAVLLGSQNELSLREKQIRELGIEIVACIPYPGAAEHQIVQARGNKHIEAVCVGPAQEYLCDLLCLATEQMPANELLLQAGRSPTSVLAAGGAAGIVGLINSQIGKNFVCLCEDVTVKDINQAIAEGFDDIETLKRYSTVTMGPCQGKMCSQTAIALCARATGQDISSVGRTTSRPPAVPVELAVLAAERRHHPVRRTPMHHWHLEANAQWLDAGQWKRPESYGDPNAEVRAVRTRVGLIDVSTLGKIEVRGPDAVTLLEKVYLNQWADLCVGKARYGVMCTEEGVVFDDGVGTRLDPQCFWLTCTTGNAEAVFQWLELWRTTWRLNVMVDNQTSAFAAMNLAGPRSREVLARLTTLDLSPASFPYMAVRQAEVNGVPCRLLRAGFVGELSYEIHCARLARNLACFRLVWKHNVSYVWRRGISSSAKILMLYPTHSGLDWSVWCV